MGLKILFIVPFPLKRAPSQRFRFEQYFEILQANGFTFSVSSFLNSHNWQLFSKTGKPLQKSAAMLLGFLQRCFDLCRAPFYHFIFIHREAAPLGPPVFEWVVKYVFKKKIIYDFDDAIWLTDKEQESSFEEMLKCRSKVKDICRWAYKVSCGNEYLGNFASSFNQAVVRLPTTIDTVLIHNPDLHPVSKNDSEITIGWTGSYSTLKYLKDVEDVLTAIQQQHPVVNFLVICDRRPSLSLPSLHFIEWTPETEIEDLVKIDIGIMPLPDNDWTKGKGGFKCLQYMALKIPAVVSNVGVNPEIIDHNISGFLVNDHAEWEKYLLQLIKDKNLRQTMGVNGRKKVEQSYSVNSNAAIFLSLFR